MRICDLRPKDPNLELGSLLGIPELFSCPKLDPFNELTIGRPGTYLKTPSPLDSLQTIFANKDNNFYDCAFSAIKNKKVYLTTISNEDLQKQLISAIKQLHKVSTSSIV